MSDPIEHVFIHEDHIVHPGSEWALPRGLNLEGWVYVRDLHDHELIGCHTGNRGIYRKLKKNETDPAT